MKCLILTTAIAGGMLLFNAWRRWRVKVPLTT